MIKREYFFKGHLTTSGREEFSGVHTMFSFRSNSAEVMREIKQELYGHYKVDKDSMMFDVFRRI